ncbi:MAG: type II toxin-antitoxin system VapC family toxin [Kiritimatiellales bacterium]|jgi:predicted nucleic acid-binding protein
MKKSVYIETSVISYLTARVSRDLVSAARQQLTQEWWDSFRHNFDLFVSRLVLKEISSGDTLAAARRLDAVKGMTVLEVHETAFVLADELMKQGALPEKAREDALHIAVSAVCGIDFLVTWNCRHIDNAVMKPVIRTVCSDLGYSCPEICTPEELGGVNHGR